MYKFSVYDFNQKEIDQIAEMVRFYSLGNPNSFIDVNGAIDRRKVSKQVFNWARNCKLITLGSEITDYKGEKPYWVKSDSKYYIYGRAGNVPFDAFYSAPEQVIWTILKPILQDHKGFYSIISDKRWLDLNVWYRGSDEWERKNESRVEHYNDHTTFGESTHLPKMYEYLALMARCGFIIFQHAGDIWRVEIVKA